MKRRNTWQKDAVRDALAQRKEFVSAQTLFSDLRERGSGIGLATVYRALSELVDSGFADGIHSPEGESLYRKCIKIHHHHLVCRDCRVTVELEVPVFEHWAANISSEHGFVDTYHVVELFGICKECADEDD